MLTLARSFVNVHSEQFDPEAVRNLADRLYRRADDIAHRFELLREHATYIEIEEGSLRIAVMLKATVGSFYSAGLGARDFWVQLQTLRTQARKAGEVLREVTIKESSEFGPVSNTRITLGHIDRLYRLREKVLLGQVSILEATQRAIAGIELTGVKEDTQPDKQFIAREVLYMAFDSISDDASATMSLVDGSDAAVSTYVHENRSAVDRPQGQYRRAAAKQNVQSLRLRIGRNPGETTPTVELTGLEDAESKESPSFQEQTVFFGTDRARAPYPVHYGTDRSQLTLGQCFLTVPAKRLLGTIPRPTGLGRWLGERADRHYILKKVEELDEISFLSLVRTCVDADEDKQALVFVHGFNCTFEAAVYQTAQIAADLDFRGAAATFSWPSVGRPTDYHLDVDQAEYAVAHLPQFLELLAARSGAKAIHLIAHSMGNQLLANAIRGSLRISPVAITELILAAPDIDPHVFESQIAPAMRTISKRTTLYVSSKDEALKQSAQVHVKSRVGDSSERVVIVEGVQTIDASAVSTDLMGHSYYANTKSVLSDIHGVIRGRAPSERFGLQLREAEGLNYWVFMP